MHLGLYFRRNAHRRRHMIHIAILDCIDRDVDADIRSIANNLQILLQLK
jgi:hypothetical protein